MFRYLGFQKFEIGEQKPDVSDKGKEITVADYGLVVGAKWTVRCQKKVILSFIVSLTLFLLAPI